MTLRQQPLADVSTPGHGQGVGPARYEFRASGTKEIVGGAGVSEANGVPPAVGCLAARSLGRGDKKRGWLSVSRLFSLLDLHRDSNMGLRCSFYICF